MAMMPVGCGVNDGKIPTSEPMTFDGAVSEREYGLLSTGQWSGGTRNGNAAYGEYGLRVPLG